MPDCFYEDQKGVDRGCKEESLKLKKCMYSTETVLKLQFYLHFDSK